MGFELSENRQMNEGFTIVNTTSTSLDEVWKQVWGEASTIRDHYNETRIELEQKQSPHLVLTVIIRAYDHGIGLRYEFPKQEELNSFDILSENTEFNLAKESSAWWIPGNPDSYEYLYKNTGSNEVDSANTPITFAMAGGPYFSIHEANLTDYAGMRLFRNKEKLNSFVADLVPWPDGVKVKAKTPFITPWRTVQFGEKPGDLITNYLILNLNEPNKISNTDWIKPLKYVGIWWSLHLGVDTWIQGERHGATTENTQRYIDFAAENGMHGALAEGWNQGWENWGKGEPFDYVSPTPDFDLNEVLQYAEQRGVEFIGHHENGGNVTSYEKHLITALDSLQSQGIHYLKTGYAGGIIPKGHAHHGQWMVNHYRRVVEEAAKRQISLNVHEPIKPTGIRRTYPNMMTREGVRGMEWNAWSEGNTPEHHTVLPFTRMLAGPIDYTPGTFDILYERYDKSRERWHPNDKGGARVHTTLAKQLALYVVLYSPWQMASDMVENYEDQPAFEFIRNVPVDWDETVVLNAEIGEYVTIARRQDDNWFIGSITDENPRALDLNLDFLAPGKTYRATVYVDNESTDLHNNPTTIEIYNLDVKAGTSIKLSLRGGGGAAVSIVSE